MVLDEFDLIKTFFVKDHHRQDILLGIGDDCAVLQPPAGKQLLVTTDTLNINSHFFPDTPAFDIGYKACAVSISDMAAMGGEPAWMMLSLTLPEADSEWLSQLSKGLFACLNLFNIALVGGNTTKGSLSVTTTLLGFAEQGQVLTRKGCQEGDLIYVTGRLGGAGFALDVLNGEMELPNNMDIHTLHASLFRPSPRVQAGRRLSMLARTAIDISDGLVADLDHMLEASGLGASIYLDQLPLSHLLNSLGSPRHYHYALTAGDDYELCFTLAPDKLQVLESQLKEFNCEVHCIGRVEKEPGLRIIQNDDTLFTIERTGYKHF